MLERTSIHERARGRWRGILSGIGVDAKFLTGKHSPCPLCGGKDRFRFDDRESGGGWICSHCGAGNGVDLVMKLRSLEFIGAVKAIEEHLGSAPVVVPKTRDKSDLAQRDQMAALWRAGKPLDGLDIASRYLSSRNIKLSSWPSCLRWIDSLAHKSEEGKLTSHPAMLAKFVAPNGERAVLHRTYLSEPGAKASVDKPKKMMPGTIPTGGAIRLGPAAETMGIAEGIENAFAASILHGVTVWAAGAAVQMMAWLPPKEAKNIIIFGDLDANFTGQMAAYNLAYRLRSAWRDKASGERYGVNVIFTAFHDTGQLDDDWSDALRASK